MSADPGPTGHHHLTLVRNHRLAIGAAITMYVAAIALLVVVAVDVDIVQPLDDAWRDAMVSIENGALTVIAKALDVIGGIWIIWPLRLIVSGYLIAARRWAKLTIWGVTAVLVELSIGPLKALYDRPRPPESMVETTNASFPSGHAIAGAATAIALVIVVFAPGERRRAWEIRAGIFAFVMAGSRVYLRAHWLTDVVAGALLGTATALAVAAIVQLLRARARAVSEIR